MINKWQEKIDKQSVFFITTDIKRGIGLEDQLSNYHILCAEYDPLIPILRQQGAKIFCLEEVSKIDVSGLKNSGQILEQVDILAYIKRHTQGKPHIMYFKPSLKLDSVIDRLDLGKIGNRFSLAEQYENKIEFYHFLNKYFPAHTVKSEIGRLKELLFADITKKYNLPFCIQFGHGWAGRTTFFITDEQEFNKLVKQYPLTRVRVGRKVDGLTLLNNCCIYNNNVYISPEALQLSGICLLHPDSGVTCGRQWKSKFIGKDQIIVIRRLSEEIGKIMVKSGYMGYFGLDFIVEKDTGKVFISELNARLTASSAFYAKLELGYDRIPLFALHIAAFLGLNLEVSDNNWAERIIGSQLILRKTKNLSDISYREKFAVLHQYDNNYRLSTKSYKPQDLKKHEFIFMQRENISKINLNDEIARIEVKDEILDAPIKLKQWVINFLSTLKE